MKLIRHMGSEQPKKEFMKFIANTVYEERALVEEKEEQLFLLEKMVEFEEGETDREEFGQRHRIECYILIILSRLCQADARNFHQLPQIMQAQGYSPLRFQKLIGQLVHNIRPVIVASDKQVWVGILMLLAVVAGSEKKKELLNCLWDALFGEGEFVQCMDYFYRIFCLVGYADWLLAQARCEFITDPEELKENHRRRAEMFR